MWGVSVPPGQHPVRLQSAKRKYRNTHKNSEKKNILHRFKDELLVTPTKVSDLKNALRQKHTLQLFENTAQHTNHYKQ